jgi:murein DD-endopeptidase MepM/ murein hydrolase activator NlpD
MRASGDGPPWIGLLGIDVDAEPGPLEIVVAGVTAAGAPVAASASLAVQARRFAERRLTFTPSFANPSPADLERARDEARRLSVIFARDDTPPLWSGPFSRPVPGHVTSGFGRRSIVNGRRGGRHAGVDLSGATGTPVRAPNAGRVALAADLFYSGNTVILDHGGGLFSFFGHLSRIDVQEGDAVVRDAVVGAVGATGRVTGPHLHWSLRVSGARVDPLRILDVCFETPVTFR